eukprot:121547-Pyramimonas_sp.AAC.1
MGRCANLVPGAFVENRWQAGGSRQRVFGVIPHDHRGIGNLDLSLESVITTAVEDVRAGSRCAPLPA